jgi:adenylate cyclase
LLILIAASTWRPPWSPGGSPTPRLSIVVLPFANLSEDRRQQNVAHGLTDDLATDLSRRAHLFVISRDSASTYRDKPVDAKQIGRELGVRYLLEGSIRRVGNQIRVNAQLAATDTAAHLWAEQFDRDVTDLFAVQSEITRRIGNALNLQIISAEAGRPTANPDAYDYLLRGRLAILHPRTRESYARAIALFEHALALDPNSVIIQSLLADALAGRVVDSLTGSAAEDIERAESLVAKALAAAPRSGFAHFVNGTVLRARRQCERAIAEFETVIVLEPSYYVEALADIGRCKIFIGPIEEAISAHEHAIRFSPNDPAIGIWYWRIGQAHLLLSRTSEAIHWLERARSVTPGLPFIHAHLASAHGLKGESELASAELAEARRLGGEGYYATIARIRARTIGLFEVPATRALFEATYLAGLRKAGVPED